MARTGLAPLIGRLRNMTQAGTADYTLAGVTYWTDDQLQDVLDTTRQTLRQVTLSGYADLIDGAYSYTVYPLPDDLGAIEENASDSGWRLYNGDGVAIGTANYSVNYEAREITFTSNQAGSIYYLDCRRYNLNKAAGKVWEQKASAVTASAFRWSSDNHMVDKSALREEYLGMARYYQAMAGAQISRRVRSDAAF